MKQGLFVVSENIKLTSNVYKMTLLGDGSGITCCGQFVNVKLNDLFLRRQISVFDVTENGFTIIYKVVGEGTEQMAQIKAGRASVTNPFVPKLPSTVVTETLIPNAIKSSTAKISSELLNPKIAYAFFPLDKSCFAR